MRYVLESLRRCSSGVGRDKDGTENAPQSRMGSETWRISTLTPELTTDIPLTLTLISAPLDAPLGGTDCPRGHAVARYPCT